jgi:hypothetical protein
MDYDPKAGNYFNNTIHSWTGYPDRLDTEELLARHPGLGELGYGSADPVDYLEVRRVFNWLATAKSSARTKGKAYWQGSYELKHIAEKALGDYVANGTLIVACLIAGIKQKDISGPNCDFCLPDLTNALPYTDQDGVER